MLAYMLAFAAGLSLYGPAPDKLQRQIEELISRPPRVLEPMMHVTGDDLDPRIEVNSKDVTALVSKGLLASTTRETSFLRAYIDRKTGRVSVQVYHYVVSGGRTAPRVHRATYDTPEGLKEVEADRVGFDVSCSRYGCTYYEDVVFPVDYELLRAAVAAYDPLKPALGIKYRLFGQSGYTVDEAIPVNEIVAFVTVVERQRAKAP